MSSHERKSKLWEKNMSECQASGLSPGLSRLSQFSNETGVLELGVPIGRDLSEHLRGFCERQQVTPSTVLMSAFQVTHFRWNGIEDATIVSFANSNAPDLPPVSHDAGFVGQARIPPANWPETKVIVGDPDNSFAWFVKHMHDSMATASGDAVPKMDSGASYTCAGRGTSQDFHPVARLAIAEPKHDGIEYAVTDRVLHMEFFVHQHTGSNGWLGTVVWSEDLYSAGTVKQIVSVFYEMLKQGMLEPRVSIATLPMTGCLSPADTTDLLKIKWDPDIPREMSIVDAFRQQSKISPATIAVKDASTRLTYAELDDESDKLCWWLLAQQLRPQSLVGVFMPRSCQAVVSFLGILKANLAYLPLDISAPGGRIQTILSSIPDSQLRVILHGSVPMEGAIPSVRCFRIDDILQSPGPKAAPLGPTPTSLAYVMFTSGSSGRPKGVLVEHRGIVRLAKQPEVSSYLHLHHGASVAHMANIAFDMSTWEIYVAILNGGTLACFDPMTVLDASTLRQQFVADDIKLVKLTPALLQELLTGPESQGVFKSVDLLYSSGDRLEPWVAQLALDSVDGRVFNAYGPTENTGHSTCFELLRAGSRVGTTVPIGWTIFQSGAVIMDCAQRLLPPGIIGELVLFGDGLSRGYLDPKHNHDRFFDLVIGSVTMKAYRTGDRARRDPVDGKLWFLGRMDSQVKVRGNRVEPGEIDHVLRSHERVKNAVTICKKSSDTKLLSFVTLHPQQTSPSPRAPEDQQNDNENVEDDLRAFLRTMVPSFMVPASITTLETIPLNQNHKVDVRKLESLESERGAASNYKKFEAPHNETERVLCEEFSAVLGTNVGVSNSFFDLGGHSLLATRVVSRINRRLNTGITVKEIFQHPTVDGLSQRVVPLLGSVLYKEVPKLQHNEVVEQSFAQRRLWFLEQLYPSSTRYVISYEHRLRGPLCVDALESALFALQQRHEPLRTTFMEREGVGFQCVQPSQRRDLKVLDVAPDEVESLRAVVDREQVRPFDLQAEPGWRVVLFRLSACDHVLSITMHHIISDGWSVGVLQRELAMCYAAALQGKDPLTQLDPLPIQYRDFAVWQQQSEQSRSQEQQLKYWKDQLEGSQPAELILDMPRPSVLSGEAGVQEVSIDGKLLSALRSFCKRQRVTPFTVLLSAFRAAHFRLTGVEDATVGFPIANRNRQELEGLIGFFVNLQCIRSTIDGDSFSTLVQQVQNTAAAAFEHQDVPFERIVAELSLNDRDASRNPLVQLTFAVHSQEDLDRFTLPEIQTDLMARSNRTRFDLEFHLYEHASGFRGSMLYAKDLFFADTIKSVVSVFYEMLEQGMLFEAEPIVSLPFSSASIVEPSQIRYAAFPRDQSIIDAFRQQVVAGPSTLAVKDPSTQLTYMELDEQSDRLCRWLARQQLPTESLVGVFMPRSCRTVVAFLGILKANLAYLPLDVNTPPGRIKTILSSIHHELVVLEGNGAAIGEEIERELKHVRCVQIDRLDDVHQPLPGSMHGVNGDERINAAATPSMGQPTATSLAYVMFTSGSSGQPKGVCIEHRGVVRLAKQATTMPHLQNAAKVAHIANIAFDASTWEIYSAILNGGTLICLPLSTVVDTMKMAAEVAREGINVAKFTPALLQQYVDEQCSIFAMFDLVISAGDRLHSHLAKRIRACTNAVFLNAYGPTENCGFSTVFTITPGSVDMTVPIGQAIDSSGALVMDGQQRLVPHDVLGELVVIGDGLARGYTDSKLDCNRFVHLTLGGQRARGYRTGDHVRQRSSGMLEFWGRLDDQCKVRGHRIELGDINQALLTTELVNDAVTILNRPSAGDEGELVSFVTPRPQCSTPSATEEKAANDAEEVEAWVELRKEVIYAEIDSLGVDKIGRDFMGWRSMYNGQPIPRSEMDQWLQDTMRSFLNGRAPGRVLEIGTGTGMVLFNLDIDGLESYFGLEPVETSVAFVKRALKARPQLDAKATIQRGTASDVASLQRVISPTTVIINSVAQYFPSPEYLRRLVVDLLQLPSVTSIFFGDIRSYALYLQFLVTMAFHHIGPDLSKQSLKKYMARQERSEMELLIDPGFFTSLKDEHPHIVKHVEIVPKLMTAANELSCYRYAAIIHTTRSELDCQQLPNAAEVEWIDFAASDMDRTALTTCLTGEDSPALMAVCNIPNKATMLERLVVESLNDDKHVGNDWLCQLRRDASHNASMSPAELIEVASLAGMSAEISWNRQYSQDGGLDVIFHRLAKGTSGTRLLMPFPSDHQDRRSKSLTNQPLQLRMNLDLERTLFDRLRSTLPGYMIPRQMKILEQLPRNRNQKVDRKALASLLKNDVPAKDSRQRVEPETDVDRALCEEFSAILGGIEVGMTDSFFELGGHSLMATRLTSRINKRLGTGLTVRDLFENPVVGAFARRLTPTQNCPEGIPRAQYEGPVEQSFAQSRLWFLEQLYPGSTRYLMPYRLRLRGAVDLSALHLALQAIEHRHETLRTTFSEQDGVGMQIVSPFRPSDLRLIHVPADSNLARMLEEEQTRPFDLRVEPGWRVAVFKISQDDHVLSIVLHHIVSDGWSVSNIRKELKSLYSAALLGKDPLSELAPLPIQYRDFSVWQKQQTSQYERQLDYWVTWLEGSQPAEFICDRPRHSTLSSEAGTVDFVVDSDVSEALLRFCQAQQTTPFPVLLAAFKATHFRLTGTADATLGSLVANRNLYELEDLVGFFVNLQCIRTTVEGDCSFRELVQQTKEATSTAIENQDVPFEQIVAKMKLANQDLSRNPLVQTIFTLAHSHTTAFELEGIQVEEMARSRRTRFDVECHMNQTDEGFRGSLLYSTDLFFPETIREMVSVFNKVLAQGLRQPDMPLTVLPLCDSGTHDFQFKHADYARESSVVDVFRSEAARQGNVIAVKDKHSQLTYSELDRESDRLASWLASQGLEPETIVGVHMPRSCQTVLTFLGILKANLAYLCFEVRAPPGRIQTILGTLPGRTRLILEDSVPTPEMAIDNLQVVKLSEALRQSNDCPSLLKTVRPSPTSLMHVMFTSGSTGEPKGIMIEHRGIVRLARQSNVPRRAKVAHISTLAFDASTWEIYTAILNGGTIVCIDYPVVLDVEKLGGRIIQEDIRVVQMTPVLLQQCLEEAPQMFRFVEMLASAGDRLHPHVARKALQWLGGHLYNAYGPAEGSGQSTESLVVLSDKDQFTNMVAVGEVVENSGAMITDVAQQPVPRGVLGEILITGDGIARGYLKPEQDRDRFINVTIDGKCVRAYRTGDYGRRRAVDGQFEFFGRIDAQLKIRGNRVELGEIEHVLLGFGGVNEAAVLVRRRQDYDLALVAFLTLRKDEGSSAADDSNASVAQRIRQSQLRKHLRARLPDYMVPSTIKVLAKMPTNQSGKIDRGRLRALLDELVPNDTREEDFVPPSNGTERDICEQYASVLETDIGATDNFFDRGGHSMLATRVLSRINRRLKCNISIFDFYQAGTPAALSAKILASVPEASLNYLKYRAGSNSKATLVLIHGMWGQGTVFSPLEPLLSEQFDLVLVHDPYFGTSKVPKSITEWARSYAHDIKSLVRRDLPVILGGFSFGGLIAFEMASLWPDICDNALVSILLLDSGSYPALSTYLSRQELSAEALDYALQVFGDDQRDLVLHHFEKLRGLSFGEVGERYYGGDVLYIATSRSISAAWWEGHCPRVDKRVVNCTHHEVVGSPMAGEIAGFIKEHYSWVTK